MTALLGFIVLGGTVLLERVYGPEKYPMPYESEPPTSSLERTYQAHVSNARVRMGHRRAAGAVESLRRYAMDARCDGLEALAITLDKAADKLDEQAATQLRLLARDPA
jgi:hypothetical protein